MTLKRLARVHLDQLFLPVAIVLIGMIFIFRHQNQIQFELVVLATILYLGTALLHHHFDKSLTIEVILEYILIALFAIIVIGGILI
jgi:hypothetical protein